MKEANRTEEMQMFLLCQAEGIGGKTLRKLLERFGSADAVFRAGKSAWEEVLTKQQCGALSALCGKGEAERRYREFARTGLSFVPFTSPAYPARLKEIPDPPKALYVRGRLPSEDVPSVAVVGARICSEYGRYMARQFGTELAQAGIQVISGMALGVDGIAQKAALMAGGASCAVLGCGADVCYPPENRELYDRLCAEGGILSEYPPGTQPQRHLFPPRNRIISGLADAVLVVEARRKSGTLITVDMALEQGKDVYALPGRATDRLSDGCNELLKQGAMIATSAADIIENFFRIGTEVKSRKERKDEENETGSLERDGRGNAHFALPQQEREIMDALDITPRAVADVEEILRSRGRRIPPQELMCRLVELSLKGLVEQEGAFFALPLSS
ncbi:MAG: DNA-processing protein DprA [Lachnospiraceae bacterium]|nr:DNA-processing protein DprA [Lachnospiraceae bacterium]